MKGFDGIFLANYLLSHGFTPKTTFSGSKIMYMHIEKGLNIKVIDSINFIQTSLANFPKMFDIENIKKGEFPHLFNTYTNQEKKYVGKYPDIKYYNADSMSPERRQKFLEWYNALPKDSTFDFQKEMEAYCNDDVNLLRIGTLKFRNIIKARTSKTRTVELDGLTTDEQFDYIDIFQNITVAGLAMNIFRTNFLEETLVANVQQIDGSIDKNIFITRKNGQYFRDGLEVDADILSNVRFHKSPIAFLPNEIYGSKDQYSKIAMKWLLYTAYSEKIFILYFNCICFVN